MEPLLPHPWAVLFCEVSMYDIRDYIGKKVARHLTVFGMDEEFLKKHPSSNRWIFACDCGKNFSFHPSPIIQGRKQSCGCSKFETITIHGCNKNEFYHTWYNMMKRCYDKESHNYERYGGRGIYVCDEWHDPKVFIDWAYETIGEKDRNYTVDRIDTNGPYAPWNCRWATAKEQGRNKESTIMIQLNGEEKPLAEWCEIYGLNYTTVRERFKRGWSIEESFKLRPREFVHQPNKRVCDKYFTIDGVERNISDWAKHYGISRHTVYKRLEKGWDILDALTTPPNKANRVDKH